MSLSTTPLSVLPLSGSESGSPPPTPPVADFSGTPTSGTAPVNVDFTDASTNTPTSWLWEKSSNGGGVWSNFTSGATTQNPTESFTEGTWAVRLTSTNAGGSDSETKLAYITSSSIPTPDPEANVNANSISFTVVGDGQVDLLEPQTGVCVVMGILLQPVGTCEGFTLQDTDGTVLMDLPLFGTTPRPIVFPSGRSIGECGRGTGLVVTLTSGTLRGTVLYKMRV